MRNKIAVLLVVMFLIKLFCLPAVAAESDQTFSKDFSVEEKDILHRYSMDIEYEDISIPVQEAVWNVNTYHYEVIMGFNPPENYTGERDQAPYTFTVKVINHSDLPITSTIVPTLYEDIALEIAGQTSLVQNGNEEAKPVAGSSATIDAVVEKAEYKSYFHQTEVTLVPKQGWESLINSMIADGATDGVSIPVGFVNIVIKTD